MLNIAMAKNQVFRGDRLKQMRIQRGLTQDDLADRIGIGRAQMNRYEREKTQPEPEIMVRLAIELGVTTDWLYGLVEYPYGSLDKTELPADAQAILRFYEEGNVEELMRAALNRKQPKKDD